MGGPTEEPTWTSNSKSTRANSKSIHAGTWANTTSYTPGLDVTTVENSIDDQPFSLTTTKFGGLLCTGIRTTTSYDTFAELARPDCAHCKCDLRGADNNLCRPCRDLLKRLMIRRNTQGEYVSSDTPEHIDAIRPDEYLQFRNSGIYYTQEYHTQ